LERAVQFLKGGFSYRAKKELGSSMEIWQRGFSDHRIRDRADLEIHIGYIYRNPVGKKLVERATDYPHCSAFPGSDKDELPQWLKPLNEYVVSGTAEAVPFQSGYDVPPSEAGLELKAPTEAGLGLRRMRRRGAEAPLLHR
jgi:putative transposase